MAKWRGMISEVEISKLLNFVTASEARKLQAILPTIYVRICDGRAVAQAVFFIFYLHSGGWNQGPLDTAAT
jgi:hypothetical protein